MDDRNDILKFECNEPEGKIVRSVSLTKLSLDRLQFLWDKLSPFDVLFNDFVKGDFQAFMRHFVVQVEGQPVPAGLFWDVDDVGILLMKDIKPLVSCTAHFVFWDRRFRGRENLCRGMIRYAFDTYKFERIEVRVPLYAQDTILAVERLGFTKEGRIRRATPYKDDWFDMNIYSILPGEIDEDFNIVNADGKNSRLTTCFDCGDSYDAALRKNKPMKRRISRTVKGV